MNRPGPRFAGARVVLGVSGGIAAYKAVEVCRRLVDAGAVVTPVLTKAATAFVGAATFSALASAPAQIELIGGSEPIPHTRLGREADLVLVVPATARLIGEYANGIARDLLVATLLATRAPVVLCPAMHAEMWEHPAVQDNIATLVRRNVQVVEPAYGRLAGGDVGAGRLADLDAILAAANEALGDPGQSGDAPLAGCRVLITAGGTREPIDPVRYLGNRSSGRQGYALAAVARERGAEVTLVSTVDLGPPAGVEVVRVETAAELAAAVLSRSAAADVVIMAAAVADFRHVEVARHKLKKRDGVPRIVLEPTLDVLSELGRRRRPHQVIVGFAAETGDVAAVAPAKLAEKGADLLVANDVSADGVGFGHDTNAVTIFEQGRQPVVLSLAPKPTIAAAVLDAVARRRAASEAERGGQR